MARIGQDILRCGISNRPWTASGHEQPKTTPPYWVRSSCGILPPIGGHFLRAPCCRDKCARSLGARGDENVCAGISWLTDLMQINERIRKSHQCGPAGKSSPQRRSFLEPSSVRHHAGKEAADRMLLPTGRLHDDGDRHPFGLFEEGEHGLLLGAVAGRTRGAAFSTLVGFSRVWSARPSSCWVRCDATSSRSFRLRRQKRCHHRSPTVALLPVGRDLKRGNGPHCRRH